ncbi:uncharacterized protein LOC119007091 [Acanthopagrus latus]|uniref:uncharacterized protein LOC119007091 n=1 Tax=Acanthopagrus latus TaxID=8177 RepID=UPI00187CA714|nr:uncharacterized protein LOC119007091 [Acanthopagrus latus]
MLIIFCVALVFTAGRCTADRSFVNKTVGVGEDVTLTCRRQSSLSGVLFWIRLVVGSFPEVAAATYTFDGSSVHTSSRFKAKQEPGTFVLYITKAELSDAAFYYCQQVIELRATFLNKTFLNITEPEVTAITQDSLSAPVRPGDSVTLQCSVLCETCPGGHSVFWFRAGSDESDLGVIHSHGGAECETSLEARSPQKCIYSFSKNVSSSDAGTYYCAVATCGKVLFGNGTKLDTEANVKVSGRSQRTSTVLALLCSALALSLLVIASLTYAVRKKRCHCCKAAAAVLQTKAASTTDDQHSQRTDEDSLIYAAPNFISNSSRSVRRAASATEAEIIYSVVRQCTCYISSPLLSENPTRIPNRDNIKMICLWIMSLLLHQAYALIPVTTVHLGESVTFSCFFPDLDYSNTRVKWYKQSVGDTLKLIITLMKASENTAFERGFPSSRFATSHNSTTSTLTISETMEEDEAAYHCGVSTWNQDLWSGTYLSVKGNTRGMTDYTVVQSATASDPAQPGDSVTLTCSLFSDSVKTSCGDEHSVLWFRVGSEKSHPNIIYAEGNRRDGCDKKPDARSPAMSCFYSFSKTVSSSDAGTYYCAVASCGEILFGNGTKLDIEGSSLRCDPGYSIVLFLLCAVVVTSVIVLAVLIYTIKGNKCDYCNKAVSLQERVIQRNLKRGNAGIHSAAVFTMMKTGSGGTRDANAVDRKRIYAAVKAFGLDQ